MELERQALGTAGSRRASPADETQALGSRFSTRLYLASVEELAQVTFSTYVTNVTQPLGCHSVPAGDGQQSAQVEPGASLLEVRNQGHCEKDFSDGRV